MTAPLLGDSKPLEAYWMPFTANRQFKAQPRLLDGAKDMYYTSAGRKLLDGTAGLWCVNAGHGRPEIAEAVHQQLLQLDYASSFQVGHAGAFALANRLTDLLPGDLNHVFFTNSGSEAVDTALKLAIAYQALRGEPSRQRLVGRQRAYHGVNLGGIAVGGIAKNRRFFEGLIPGVDHLGHTHNLAHNAFSRGQPQWGEALAEELETVVAQRGAETIAAMIVEPIYGATGVLIPPVGYLQKLRDICDRHGILLIFDEVITGFGRLGVPFAAEYFGVQPDLITAAKGLTNGSFPMGAVFVRQNIYDTFMAATASGIEFFHGYTYSGHPVACAAALATLDIYASEGLFNRVQTLMPLWETAAHSLKGTPHIIDIRNLGLLAGIELAPTDTPGERGAEVFRRCFEQGLFVRAAGDTIVLSPPLIIEPAQIEQIFTTLAEVLNTY
ncbi:MAG: aspartate aminotransferase family protein [Nodosilinea sp.]